MLWMIFFLLTKSLSKMASNLRCKQQDEPSLEHENVSLYLSRTRLIDRKISRSRKFLLLHQNAPKSSSLSIHAFAKRINISLLFTKAECPQIIKENNVNDIKGLRVRMQNISTRFDTLSKSVFGHTLLNAKLECSKSWV